MPKGGCIMLLNHTPVDVLKKEIAVYERFKTMLQTRDGIDPTTPQEKLDDLIKVVSGKVEEFQKAIGLIDPSIEQPECIHKFEQSLEGYWSCVNCDKRV